MFVYSITNKINNKKYIGKTNNLKKRWYRHCNNNGCRAMYSAIKKYGKNNFELNIIEKCFSKKELNNKEIIWIKKLNTLSPNGYNLTKGGDGIDKGNIPWNKGKKGIQTAWNKGKKNCFSEKTLKKMSKSRQGRKVWNKGREIFYNRKKVKTINTNEIFDSVKDAASAFNLHKSCVFAVILGYRNNTKVYKFKYIN